jgi:hypothetical protein
MHRNTRPLLSLMAALSLVVAGSGAVGASSSIGASASSGALSTGTEVLPIYRGDRVRATKSARTVRTNNLLSNGGAVQVTPKVYISWWGPEWANGFSTGAYTSVQAQAYNVDFFSNVGGSAWNNVVKQYCKNVPRGTQFCSSVSGAVNVTNPAGQFAGAWNDPTSVPANPTQNDIASAAIRLQQHVGPLDPNATYMVFTPSGKSMSGFGTQWCAWHSWTTINGSQLAYAYIPYMPDAGVSCGRNFVNATNSTYGNGWFDGFSVVAGHEYSEAETDPFPSAGWVDRNGAENADKCAWSGASRNINLGGQSYAVQPTWSNAIKACAMSAT